MLGELIFEETGKIIGQRILPVERGPRIEVTFESHGKVLGVASYNRGTYVAEVQPDGSLVGEGQGVVVTPEGIVTWQGKGTGHMVPSGDAVGGYTVQYRGAIFPATGSAGLSRLNGMCLAFEFDTDQNDAITARAWEWK